MSRGGGGGYDANGSLTNDGAGAFTWDARNRLTAITATPASFVYDGVGRRTTATLGGVTRGYLYDGGDIVQELSGATPSAGLLTGLSVDERFSRTVGGAASTFLTDALGSTIALADSTGAIKTSYAYDPGGVTSQTGAANTSAYQFTGRENDGATGLYYDRARFYDPAWGRFISEDPIGLAGGVNLYEYANGDPISEKDARGLLGVGLFGGGSIGGGLGPFGSFAYHGSLSTGDFIDNNLDPSSASAAAFGSSGGFAGGPGGPSYPKCPSGNNFALGAYGGWGTGAFLTNAEMPSDITGPFKVASVDIGVGPVGGSIQYQWGYNADGKPIWVVNIAATPFPGLGLGIDVSLFNSLTNIIATTR